MPSIIWCDARMGAGMAGAKGKEHQHTIWSNSIKRNFLSVTKYICSAQKQQIQALDDAFGAGRQVHGVNESTPVPPRQRPAIRWVLPAFGDSVLFAKGEREGDSFQGREEHTPVIKGWLTLLP